MSALGAGRTVSLAEKVKLCNTCGDSGFDDCLAFCNHCNEGAEHVYCMVTVFDTVPLDWICEGCKVKQRVKSRKRMFVCDGIQPIQAHKKQVLNNSFSAKSLELLPSSSFKKDSVENGTEHFVTMQADKTPSKGPACQGPSMGGATIKEISLAERDQLPFSNVLTQKLRSNISHERNSVCTIESDVNKHSHRVIPAKGISAKVSLCSETDKAVVTSRCHSDRKKITQKDLLRVSPESFAETINPLPNSQSPAVVARIVKKPSCLAEPLESAFVQDTSVIATDTKISGEEVESEEQELNNTVLASVAEGKQVSVEAEHDSLDKTVAFSLSSLAKPVAIEKEEMEVISGPGKLCEAEHHNLNKTVAFSSSSLAKPVASDKELMEVHYRTGKLVPIGRTASIHTTSMAEKSSINADAEHHNLNKTAAFTSSSLAKPVATDTELMEVSSRTGNLVLIGRTASIHTTSMAERTSINADAEISKNTDSLIRSPTSNGQLSIISSTFVKPESMKVASSFTTGEVFPVCTIAPIHMASIVQRKNVSVDEDAPNHMDIAIEKPTSNSQGAIINSMSLKLESMKGTSSSGTGNVVSERSPVLTTPFSERSEDDVPNHMVISSDRAISKPQHAIVNSTSIKTESYELVKRSRLHPSKVTIRDFPIITQKIKFLGEKGEKIPNRKSKEKLLCEAFTPLGVEGLSCPLIPGGNVVVKEETATGQEINVSANKLQAKEEVNIIGGSTKSFNLFCEGEEHHQSGGVLLKGMTTGQETDGSCNRLKAKEEEIAKSDSVELIVPSSFVSEEKTQPQNVMHKGGAAGSLSCLIRGSAEFPSLFFEEEKTLHQNVKQKVGMAGSPSCLMGGSVEPPSEEDKAKPQNVQQKGGAAGSPSYWIKNSGLGKVGFCSRTAPALSVPAIEKNVESLTSSPCITKGSSQENCTSVASGAGMDKTSHVPSKRVVRRDFPPLMAQIGKVGRTVGPTCKAKVVTPLEDKEQVTGSRSDADTEMVMRSDAPAITQEVLSGKRKNGSTPNSMGYLAGVMTSLEDEKRLSFPTPRVGDVSAKQTVSTGIDIKAASRRPEAEREVFESKESVIFPLSSCDTRPEDKECHGNTKQECDATGLASCVTRELPTNGVSSTIGDEVASVIKTVPTSFESASMRNATKKNLSSPRCKEGSLSKGAATLKRAKAPPCLPGQMEGVTVKDTPNIQLDKKKVFRRDPVSRSDGLSILLNSSTEGECVDGIEGHHILRQNGALEAVAASSCQARSSGNVPSAEGIVMRDASNAPLDKMTFTGKRLPSVEADHGLADRDYSDKVKISPGRHASRSQCGEQLSFFEPRLRESPRRNKGAVSSSISSTRDRHGNATYIERESEDNGFHARHADAGCEPSDWMDLRTSTVVRPRQHTLPDRDVEFRSVKQDRYSRGSRRQASESSSYKGDYRCHRCDAIGHTAEFCKADRQKEWRTPLSSDFDDRDFELGHAKRDLRGFEVSDGRQRKYDPRRVDRFMNSRPRVESDAVDCVRMRFKKPPKVSSEHTRYDEERRCKLSMREEASFERETSRLEISHSLNGMKSELKPSTEELKHSEYIRVHKRQILRAQVQGSFKAATHFENGKGFPVQGNATSVLPGPAGAPRGGYVNRLLPNQFPLIPQDQVCKDRISQNHVAPQLRESSIRNFAQERRAAPDRQVMWTGCLEVSSKTGWETCYQGLQARPSSVAHSKVFEALLALPSKLEMEEKKRGVETGSWPRCFQESPPTSHSIGIYFFSTDMESYGKWYKPLLHRLAARDLALKVQLEFAQLLIFPSQILPEADQCWEDRFFLWGIFKRNVEDLSHLLWQPSCRDPGSDLGSPTGNGEVIDMDVDVVGRKDAVLQERQEFNPPLPPGFQPAPPYSP